MTRVKAAFHLLSVALLTYPYYWISSNPTKINSSYGWHFQMLTILTLSVAYAHFWVAVAQDLRPKSALLRSVKRALLLIACPCETLVSSLYWPIKFYDASLLAPPELMALFPIHADISMHAVPTVLLLIETFVFSAAIETSNARAALIYAAYGTGYYFWTERNARLNGWYPYPMFDLMSRAQRIGTFVGATAIAFLAFLVLKKLHNALYRQPGVHKPASKSRMTR